MSEHLGGLPDTLRIGPFDIKMTCLEKVLVEGRPAWGSYAHGVEIELELGMPRLLAVDTVLHEISHAIYRCYGVAGDEEHCVSAFATGWTQVLRDNPALLSWIARRLK